ncbi:MAG: 2-isopropylmalate synthase [Nitrospirota bacterium]|nr:2-isopropylmalate synthase [Nitrospirota bacterium]
MSRTIRIFDTTLRDGEQSPGCSMNIEEKLTVARQLARMKVDIIEAGFPIASDGDFQAVRAIAEEIKGPVICGLARAKEIDIDRAGEAIKPAERGRIHTFIATSDIHLRHKLRISREEVLEQAVKMVKYARRYTDDVEFSAEDAFRSDHDFLCKIVEAVIDAGATTVNIPDTVGYAIPSEFGALIAKIRNEVPNIDKAIISVHCHNDLGLAVSNSLAAIQNGAGQVECTVNGIGERAGNAAMEEIVMALKTRRNLFEAETGIVSEEIMRSSRLLSTITGVMVQPNKAIVGANAFAHESGIHQDGVLKEKSTYEIMTPDSVGLGQVRLVLGKHSGRHAFKARLLELGHELSEEEINRAFARFKHLADQKKDIFDEDIEALVADEVHRLEDTIVLKYLNVESGTSIIPTATIEMEVDGQLTRETGTGDGPVDAALKTIEKVVGSGSRLTSYVVQAITGGTEAQGEVTVRIEDEGRTFIGHGADTDIIVASAKAYINALNKQVYWKRNRTAGVDRPRREPA